MRESSVLHSAPVAGLDMVRVLAAMMVALFHLAYWSWAHEGSTGGLITLGVPKFEALAPFSSWGWVGVEIFFVLSGFVIAFSANGKTPWSFAQSRLLRLYPTVWVCAIATGFAILALSLTLGTRFPVAELPALFLRAIVIAPFGPWIGGVYWTLAIEMMFYGLVFLVLAGGWFDRLRWFVAGLGLVSAAWLFIGPTTARWSQLLLLQHGCFFAVGCYIWIGTQRRLTLYEMALTVLLVVAGVREIMFFAVIIGVRPWTAITVWLSSVIAIASLVHLNDKVISIVNENFRKWLRVAGLATYPFYLIHSIIGAAFIRLCALYGMNNYICLVISLLMTPIISVCIVIFVEPVVQNIFRQSLGCIMGARVHFFQKNI